MNTIEGTRNAAIRRLARDLKVDLQKAERWCDAWERFAERHGVAWNPYFWDSARGWIDAQRSMERSLDRWSDRKAETRPAEREPWSHRGAWRFDRP
jgi:hypothetical protein